MGRRKDVLLFVLAIAALVVAVYTFRRPLQGPPAKQTAATTPAKTGRETAKAGGEAGAQKGAGQMGTSLPAGGAMRSPFEGPGAAAGAAAAGKKPQATPGKTPEGAGQQTPGPSVTPLPMGPKPSPLPALPGPKPASAQAQTLTLNGILAGRQAMAVIRQGEQRYYVRVGDRVADRYRVQTITQKEVVLVGSEGKVILRMGGRQ